MKHNTPKKTILQEGARLIHAKGFNHTGLQEILREAGIPKGSFYFYFRSKDEFGLELVDYYWELIEKMGQTYLKDSTTPPLKRLERLMDAYQAMFENMGLRCGCPIGNLMQEMSDLSEPFREKVGDIYSCMHGRIEEILTEAKNRKELPTVLDPSKTAQFILDSWEGAIMHMKLTKSSEPLTIFKLIVFDHILKTTQARTGKRRARHG